MCVSIAIGLLQEFSAHTRTHKVMMPEQDAVSACREEVSGPSRFVINNEIMSGGTYSEQNK